MDTSVNSNACMSKPGVRSLGCLCGLDSSQSSATCQWFLKFDMYRIKSIFIFPNFQNSAPQWMATPAIQPHQLEIQGWSLTLSNAFNPHTQDITKSCWPYLWQLLLTGPSPSISRATISSLLGPRWSPPHQPSCLHSVLPPTISHTANKAVFWKHRSDYATTTPPILFKTSNAFHCF